LFQGLAVWITPRVSPPVSILASLVERAGGRVLESCPLQNEYASFCQQVTMFARCTSLLSPPPPTHTHAHTHTYLRIHTLTCTLTCMYHYHHAQSWGSEEDNATDEVLPRLVVVTCPLDSALCTDLVSHNVILYVKFDDISAELTIYCGRASITFPCNNV
jgi:hypothetical protein